MREILFRGKRSGCGTWEYGAVATHIDGTTYIICPNFDRRVVNPHTLGQYTGLKDKNGKRIFEGDVVEIENGRFVVEWVPGFAAFFLRHSTNMKYVPAITPISVKHMEIIGNVHDNQELLEAEEC